VILEHSGPGLTVHARGPGEVSWTTAALTEGDVLDMPEIGITVPVAEFYEGLEVDPSEA